MTTEKGKEKFRQIANTSLEASEACRDFFRDRDCAALAAELTTEDVSLLKRLIVSRIEILNSFEILCRLSPPDAVDVLIRRYVGIGVSPYSKFGGFEFELSSMLDDIREACGEMALHRLVVHAEFDRKKLEDPRVLNSLAEALDLDDHRDVLTWAEKVRAEQKNGGDA